MPRRKRIDESENEVIENLDVDAEAGIMMSTSHGLDTAGLEEVYDTRLLPGGESAEIGGVLKEYNGPPIVQNPDLVELIDFSTIKYGPSAELHPWEGCSVWGSWRGGPEGWWEVTDGKLVHVSTSEQLHPWKQRLDHIPGNKIPDEMELA